MRTLGELSEAAVFAVVEEHFGNRARECDATSEHAVRALLRQAFGIVARRDDLLRAFRELPLFEQPPAHGRMIDAELLGLARDQRGLVDLLVAEPFIEARAPSSRAP